MALKDAKFSCNLLLVNKVPFTSDSFDLIQDIVTEKNEIKSTSKEGKAETLNIKTVTKSLSESRFVCIYILEGDRYPYAEKVMSGENLEVVDNPRGADLIEMDKQLFVVIDVLTQIIWLSDQRQKTTTMKWLAKVIKSEVEIKSVISEQDFINSLASVSNIYLYLNPNLFNSSEGTLSQHLVKDMRGYEADVARVDFIYKSTGITDNIKEKIRNLFTRRNDFREICVVGKNDEGLETVLNLDSVTTKVQIQVDQDDTSKLLNPEQVFSEVITQIKNHHGKNNQT